MVTQLPSLKMGADPPTPAFGPSLLWTNGWMHQDAMSYGDQATVLNGDPASLPKQKAEPPIFGPYLLWPNGWMDEDATWYGGRPRPKQHCVTWGLSSPLKKGHSPQFLAHVYCGRTAVCISIPLGTEVGHSLGDIVLDGDPAPRPLKGHSPQFSANDRCGQTA